MKAIVLLLALASAAFADEYTPVDWLVVTESSGVALYIEDGEFKWVVGAFTYFPGSECFGLGNFTINDATHSIRTTKWQRRQDEDSTWGDVSGTEHTGGACGLTMTPDMLGEFRLVAEVEVDGAIGKYASRNTLVIAGGPETSVEAVTWGSLKARAAHGPSADRTD